LELETEEEVREVDRKRFVERVLVSRRVSTRTCTMLVMAADVSLDNRMG
jgi:hypothetical protein